MSPGRSSAAVISLRGMAGSSDEEIEAAVIGGPTVHDDTIHLAEYDEAWADSFVCEATRIRAALGEAALMVEHVGSTSVPGLAAKPIIDIVLTVADSSDEADYVPALEAAGYVLRIREPEWFEHRVFKGPDINVNMHVFSEGCSEVDRMLMFRDHLRANDADRELYERTKRELAARRWKYVQHYANAKSEVVAEIMTRAVRPLHGRLVVLNGVSSAGKTTLASAFRDARAAVGEFWFLAGIDDVLSKLPEQWVDLGLASGEGSHAHEGLRFETGPNGVSLRVGPVCRQLFEVYHRTVAAAVRSGLNVIVDEVVVDETTRDDWFHVLDGLDPTWVAIHCAPEIADQRERARGDRPIGMASVQQAVVHRGIPYAVEIDTGTLTPGEALTALLHALALA